MTPDDLDAIVTRAASVYPEDAGWDGDEAERALTTVTQHVPALAAALREAWAERDSLNDARNVLTDAVATLTQERDGARETVMADEVVARMVAHSAGLPVDFAVPLATVVTETVTAIKRLREERDAAIATLQAVPRGLSDERLSAIRADFAERVVPSDSCFGCLFDPDIRAEGITAYKCSGCGAPYCKEHRDCDRHDHSNEQCGCSGKPIPWEPWSGNVELLAMADELIAMRALVRGGDRG